ncbi:hypothetical protein BDV25DRAFT_137101 [Aspergillus avenaceus]|uniref:NAD-dependent epimerase/dehydratase domain-containing protein n=1 Tax=Aspergillus avenaceus TaxID=36643 RepID=A0A5N6U3I7_ASPAV|nr:hypothetical protein BDV25DRAFT_137101 [Aspergillus avenaceus]
MKTVFITGATGYIGGDVLSQLIAKYPDFTYRVLVRGTEKAGQVKARYPSVEIVYGSLDDIPVLETESANADIIIHTADSADHVQSAEAIRAGILKGHTADRPVYWLHTSGAGIFSYLDTDEGTYGIQREKIYNYLDGIQDILTIPDHAFHRAVDKIALEAGEDYPHIVKTAIVSPTTVYGRGRGACSQRSRQVYELATRTLEQQNAPIIGEGKSIGCSIHIKDLTNLYGLLFDAALSNSSNLWGGEAYYLAEDGEHCWGDLAREIAEIATRKGYIPAAGFEAASWGLNARCRAYRARKPLGWTPKAPKLENDFPDIVDEEWKRLQSGTA